MLRESHALPKLLLSMWVCFVITLASCNEATVTDKTPRQSESPEITRARTWADNTLAGMSLEEKVGQLLVVNAPVMEDSVRLSVFAEVLHEYHIGGVVLPHADRSVQARIARWCRLAGKTPLWVALDADAGWSAMNHFPHLLGLGAAHSDSLAYQWGRAIGAEGRGLGAQICLSSAVKVSPPGMPLPNSPGGDPEQVARLGTAMVRGLQTGGLTPCLRAFPNRFDGVAFSPSDSTHDYPGIDQTPEQLLAGPLLPLRSSLDAGPVLLQSTMSVFSRVDSLPAAFSPTLNRLLLRQGLQYQRPIFSPSFDDPAFAVQYGPGEAEALALRAGADVVLQPADPALAVKAILQAVEAGRINPEELDQKVHRVLFQKALMGMDTQYVPLIDQALMAGNRLNLQALNHEITNASLALLRDVKRRIPLGNNVEEAKIATLAIGERRKTPMQSVMDEHLAIDHFLLNAAPTASACASELARLQKYDYVLVAIHASVTAQSDSLPENVSRFLGDLQGKTRLIVTHFGSMKALSQMDTLHCVVVAPDEREATQKAAGQFLWGGARGGGKLPVQLQDKYCAGDGLARCRPTRLEYVDAEDLGIDPAAIKRIDSIINTAIWTGAFPGCQILAARDGKVFLHKAYGFHDYDHTRRVQLSDLYDIASVTKIVSTTLMAMRAYEADTLKLHMPLRYYLEELDSNFVSIKDIILSDLLIHKAGLPPGLPVYKYYTVIDSVDSLRRKFYNQQPDDSLFTVRIAEDLYFNRNYLDTIWKRVRMIPLNPVKEYKYSDVSMFLMKAVVERIYSRGLDTLVRENFYRPLGLQTAGYHPLKRFEAEQIAPTERDTWWRKQQLRGYVHDHSTALYGGVGGQAGIFSNARDLAIIMQMLLNGGEYGGKRYFKASTVERFTSRQPDSHRGLGFDMQRPIPEPGTGYCCLSASPRTFGHFGFTGTCAWADPENGIVYIFLSNRVYPKAKNGAINSLRVRQSVQQAIYDALGLMETYCVTDDYAEFPDSLRPDTLAGDTMEMLLGAR